MGNNHTTSAPSLPRRLFAHGFRLSTWGSALVGAGVSGWFLSRGAVPNDWMFLLPFVFSVLCAVVLGWWFGALFLWPLTFHLVRKLGGIGFQTGQRVRILTGPHRGRSTRVYDVWPSRHQLRVELDEDSWRAVKDVFFYSQVWLEPEDPEEPRWKEKFIADVRARASHGNNWAQWQLGNMHQRGDGLPLDPVEAYFWHSLAAETGGEKETVIRDILEKNMTPKQISTVKKRIKKWQAPPPVKSKER